MSCTVVLAGTVVLVHRLVVALELVLVHRLVVALELVLVHRLVLVVVVHRRALVLVLPVGGSSLIQWSQLLILLGRPHMCCMVRRTDLLSMKLVWHFLRKMFMQHLV